MPGLITKLRWLAKSLDSDGAEYETRMAQATVFDAMRKLDAGRP